MTYKMKRIIATFLVILSINITSNAQIFMIDEDVESLRLLDENFDINTPTWHNSGEDWYEEYVPVGEGAILLTFLGGAYVLRKRKKK